MSITKEEAYYLADIAWYIKGQLDIAKLNNDYISVFSKAHIDALESAIGCKEKDNTETKGFIPGSKI